MLGHYSKLATHFIGPIKKPNNLKKFAKNTQFDSRAQIGSIACPIGGPLFPDPSCVVACVFSGSARLLTWLPRYRRFQAMIAASQVDGGETN